MPHDAAAINCPMPVWPKSNFGPDCSLGRKYKLLSAPQFKAVFRRKTSIHGRFFSVHASRNELDTPRFGVVVSRKVSKKAVQRNRIKRQIRESFRLNRTELASLDYVVVSKYGCAQQDNPKLETELDTLWRKVAQKCNQKSNLVQNRT